MPFRKTIGHKLVYSYFMPITEISSRIVRSKDDSRSNLLIAGNHVCFRALLINCVGFTAVVDWWIFTSLTRPAIG